MAMGIIDIDGWERKSQFLNFNKYSHPVFSIGVRLDVSNLVDYCKNNKRSFFITFLYIVTKNCNEIKELKTRIVNDKVVQYDVVHPSFVVLYDDKGITTCRTSFDSDFKKFYETTDKKIKEIKSGEKKDCFSSENSSDCLYFSSVKWLDFVSVSNPYDFADSTQTSVPRIVWGKYKENVEGEYEMPFNVSVHHGLVDGWHIACLVENIEKSLEDVEKFLGVEKNER